MGGWEVVEVGGVLEMFFFFFCFLALGLGSLLKKGRTQLAL